MTYKFTPNTSSSSAISLPIQQTKTRQTVPRNRLYALQGRPSRNKIHLLKTHQKITGAMG